MHHYYKVTAATDYGLTLLNIQGLLAVALVATVIWIEVKTEIFSNYSL